MSGRAQGRGRQSRRERPQRNRGRDNSADSVNSTTSTRGERERGDRSNGRNSRRRPEKRDDRPRKTDDKPRENTDKQSSRSNAAERRDTDRGKRPEKLPSRDRIESSGRETQEQNREGNPKSVNNDRHGLFGDDSRLSHLMKRITRETDRDRRMTAAQQLEEFLNNPENFQIIIASADNVCAALEDVFHERGAVELKDQVACCLGFVGGLLGYDTRKFFQWIMDKVNTAPSDDIKTLLLNALSKTLQMDRAQQYFEDSVVNSMMNTLQNVLENVDSPDLLQAVLSVMIPIAIDYPPAFAGHFRDTIDILVGWHIDTTQQNSVNRYTSDCLVKLHPYWIADMAFSLTLLSQFLEDMEAYAEELNMLASDKVTAGDIPSPYVSLPKLTALVRVFTTVVDGIGPYFTPNKTPSITPVYLCEVTQRIIQCITISGFSYYYEKLFVSANECLETMCNWLQAYFACCCDAAAEFLSQQLKCAPSVTYTHIMSVLVFIDKVILRVNTAIPSSFIEHLLQPKSPIMELRLSTDQAVLTAIMKIYQGFLGIHDVPLLETAYRIAVAELKERFSILKKAVETSTGSEVISDSPGLSTDEKAAPEGSLLPTDQLPQASGENPVCKNKKVAMTVYEAETIIIFDLCALSDIATSKSAILGLWKLSPTLFELLTQHLDPCEWKVATCCPAIQYTILHALYTHAQRHHHFLPSSLSNTSKIPVGSADGDVVTLLKLLSKVLGNSGTPDDSKKLCLVWLVEILEHLYSTKSLPKVAEYLSFDTLAGCLLPLTFAHSPSVCLDACQCLLTLVKLKLLSRKTMMRCFQDCIMRLTDTNRAVREGFLEFIRSLPTDVLTSFPVKSLLQSRTAGKKDGKLVDQPLTTNCRDIWWARKSHIIKQSIGSFHSNNFQVILGFLLSGQLPSKDIQDDWLSRLFHSCNRTNKYMYTESELAQFNRCESLLWFWSTWEAAQFCIMSKLRTPLGRAQETFQAIEGSLHKYASEMKTLTGSGDTRAADESTFRDDKVDRSALGPKPYVAQLQSVVLLQFVENLEKLMYNAYEGSAVGLPSPPKSVRAFFRTNRSTCLEWLTRIRRAVMTVGTGCGCPALTVWHGFQTLEELKSSVNSNGAEFRQAVLQLVVALCELKSSEAIMGLKAWCSKNTEQDFSWMKGMALKAQGRFEVAADECKNLLDKSMKTVNEQASQEEKTEKEQTFAPEVSELLVNEVLDCYIKLSCWSEVSKWQKHISSLRKECADPTLQHSLQLRADMNYVKALGKFEEFDFPSVREHLQLIPGVKLNSANKSAWTVNSSHSHLDFFPAWSPEKASEASEVSLMQAETLFFIGGNSKAKDSNHKEGKLIQALKESIEQSVLLSESAVHVGSLSWPPQISASHFLQLQFASAADGLVQSIPNQGNPSSSLLQGDGTFTVDPSQHDCAVMNRALRFADHLHHLTASQGREQERAKNDLTSLQLATAKLARKHQNFQLAQKMLLKLLNSAGSAVKIGKESDANNQLLAPLLTGLSGLSNTSQLSSKLEYLKIQRECAKLAHSLGHTADALHIMSDSVLQYSRLGDIDSTTGSLNARSLLSLTKWLLSEHKLLTGVTKGNGEHASLASKLSSLCDLEVSFLQRGYNILMPNPGEAASNLKGVATGVSDPEFMCGQLLHLSTMQCPDLGKAWFNLAAWCYRWGRRTVEQASSMGNVELLSGEKQQAIHNMPEGSAEAEVESVLLVLGQVYSAASHTQDEDIGEDDQWRDDGMDATRKQLVTVCPRLHDAKPELLNNLLSVWKGVRDRLFKHYHFAVRAYFMYLRRSDRCTTGAAAGKTEDVKSQSNNTCTSDDDSNVTATLRLLRLLVKHAGELKAELEEGLARTPTRPWKDITPQLFSRLNHPESYVRQSVSELLCRVAEDAPHLIVYPAVVGSSTTMPKFLNKDKDGEGGLLPLLAEPLELAQNKPSADSNSPPQNQATCIGVGKSEVDNSLQSCYHTIVESLRSHNPDLITELHGFVQELRRITVLWEELWLGSLIQTHHDVMRRQQQLGEEIKRVNSNPTLASQQKAALIREKHWAIMKPVVFALEQLHKITSQPAATPHEQWFQSTYSSAIEKALAALKTPEDPAKHAASWEPFKQLLQTLQARSVKRSAYTLQMEDISPTLQKIKSSSVYMPGQTHFGGQIVTIDSVVSEVNILPTKTKPKKIVFIGSDGQRYTYLFKGLEDLHLDERIMQFLSICNNMFARSDSHDCPLFRARHYSVTPLGPRSGLIQWVDGAVPVFALYKRWQQREVAAAILAKTTSGSNQPPPQPSRPSELFYSKMTPALKEKGITDQSNRKEWPLSVMRRVLEMLLSETPKDLLAKELWCSSTGSSEWWYMTQCYARSTAVMSMIGYILGLGDRHLDNMLIDFTTGEVVHIDYNVCFEKGKGLRVPEKVPFRMTANLETALGVTGVEGVFRLSCEQVLKILKQGRETLLTLLEAFVYDPLVDWTTANDNAFASSFYGGGTTDVAETKMNKKEMERGVTHSLFSSRVAEMKVNWTNNRNEMLSGLKKLDENMDSFILSVKQLKSMETLQEELKEQQETLKNAVSNSSHPLHSVQAKYDEQTKLRQDHESVLQNIKDKLTECQQWQRQHEAAMETVHGQQLGSLAGEVLQPLDLGLPSFAPSISLLQGAGQGHIITQCEQLETELSGSLHQRRAMLRSGLDLLHTYATVASQFPKDYVRHNRSHEWQNWLHILTEDSSTKRCQEILSECEKAKRDGPLAIATVTALMSMEVKLQSNLTEQNPKFIKFCDRRKQESVETAFLNKAVAEALANLKKHLQGKPASLMYSLTSVLITALCSLSTKCLFMESTAKVAGERLAELTSLDGDWFLDELCSMSGNVIQLLSLLREYPIDVDAEFKPRLEEATDAMRGVAAVHKSFTALQELISNFRAIILPETMKSLHSQDISVLTMMGKLQDIASTQKLSLAKITEYIEAKLKGDDTPTQECSPEELDDVLKKMASEFEELLHTERESCNDAGVHNTSNSTMTAGQMLLAGFNGLFTKVSSEFNSMLVCLKKIRVGHEEQKYGIMKEAQELHEAQVLNYGEKEQILQSQLFFIKRVQVMTEFFKACRKLTVSLEGKANASNEPKPFSDTSEGSAGWNSEDCVSEDDLAMFAKQFIANFLQQCILGLPSRVLGTVVIKYVTLLKGSAAFEASGKDGVLSLEETCKKVVDLNMKNKRFTSQQLSRVSSLTSAYDVAWRKHDFAKRLDNNVALYKGIVQRAQLQLARFQWLYEDDLLLCPMRGNTMITPARANVMADLRKRVQGLLQLDSAVKALEEKFIPQESSIEQRLKWAAGANPALNPVLQEFEKTLSERKQLLLVESKHSSDICSLSKAILHFEALRTSTADAVAMDKAMAALVKRCEDSSKHLEKCADKLCSVESVIKKMKLVYPPEAPITQDWMKSKLDSVGQQIASCKSKKTQMVASITSNKEVLKSHAGSLKTVVVGHQQLIGEVKSMLTTMAKDEEAIESRAAKQFISTHNQLSEECTQLIRNIQGVCSGKVDSSESRLIISEEKITDFKNTTTSIAKLVEWIHDCLLTLASPLMPDELNSTNGKTPIAAPPPTFASALRQGNIQGNKEGRTPETVMSGVLVPHPVILQRDTSSPAGSSPTTRAALPAAASPRKASTAMSRDPRTGKALQERNTYAISVWRRVKAKLDGKDGDNNKRMSVTDQVDFVIRESTSLDNLCQMYEGWTSWV